ncbi:hypothetical protein DPSP01_013700 [Paraphaeosphaeria sporulosa]
MPTRLLAQKKLVGCRARRGSSGRAPQREGRNQRAPYLALRTHARMEKSHASWRCGLDAALADFSFLPSFQDRPVLCRLHMSVYYGARVQEKRTAQTSVGKGKRDSPHAREQEAHCRAVRFAV